MLLKRTLTVFLVSALFMPLFSSAQLSEIEVRERLSTLINSDDRSEALRARNQYRHPLETLLFFGLSSEQTVVEIWPGGQSGWYRSILEPFFEGQSGRYIPVTNASDFPAEVSVVADNSADRVFVFRAHGFLIYDEPLQSYYQELFRMVKPGGIFGIVDHRELESRVQDPKSENGYVKQSYIIALAENAGFEFMDSAEINANVLDTKDHPDGLYSLPPTLRGSRFNAEFRERMQAIGESDRMTLMFRKPL